MQRDKFARLAEIRFSKHSAEGRVNIVNHLLRFTTIKSEIAVSVWIPSPGDRR